MTRERDRYGRATLAERVGDLLGWFRAHPIALLAVAILLGGIIVQLVAPRRSALPNDLALGDCLFVPTADRDAIGAGARPIGSPEEVASVLLRGGAEHASCTASHGHEVSAIVDIRDLPANPRYPIWDRACDAAFEAYVGRVPKGSEYETFPIVPTQEQFDGGVRRAICLISRTDGQWMMKPARGSGE